MCLNINGELQENVQLFFVCHQINGVFVNNNDLDLIRLQFAVIAGQHLSITRADHGTCGDCGEWRHSWERFLFTAFSKESRTDCFIFIFCLVWPGQGRGGEARGVQTL